VIAIMVNGKPREIDVEIDIAAFLQALEIDPRTVAVARNGEVVPRDQHANVTVREGDSVEIVRMVGGG
jgi:thiamine biosynthesis protein ThiS